MRIMNKIAAPAVLTVFLGITSTVWAVPPDRAVFFVPLMFDIPCQHFAFGLKLEMEVESVHTYFYDKDGVFYKWLIHNSAEVKMYRADEIGDTLTGRRGETQIIDPRDFSGEVNGPMVTIVAPGYGPLFFEVGRIEIDSLGNFYFKGVHHDWNDFDSDAACAFFAGF